MNNALLVILSVVGVLALYWVLFGQWKFNKMMQKAEKKNEELSSDKAK